MNHNAQILRYWRAVEIFNPQSVPDVELSTKDVKKRTDRFTKRDTLASWETGYKGLRAAQKDHVWRHEVYGGIYAVKRVRELLEKKFGNDPKSFDSRLDSLSACFQISVDQDGRPLFGTFVLSACVWAWGRTISPGPNSADWLEGFDDFAKELLVEIRRMFAVPDEDHDGLQLLAQELDIGRRLTLSDIDAITNLLFTQLGLSIDEVDERARISSRQIREMYGREAERADFLNSFFTNDLELVASAFEEGNVGSALRTYLHEDSQISESGRIDIRTSVDSIYSALAPSRYPNGRWPGKGHHPLVLGQQFAINSITRELGGKPGIFSVNGPPGTGKTTLLRDLVAHVVVERARRFSALQDPRSAFDGVSGWASTRSSRSITLWKPEYTGFEIVVASSNNGAVENITLELPGADAIDEEWKSMVDYFPRLAARAVGDDKPVWGLLAARLGNKGNRMQFLSSVWRDDKSADKISDAAAKEPLLGLKTWLEQAQSKPSTWSESVARFRNALKEEETGRSQRERWSSLSDTRETVLSQLDSLQKLAGERERAAADADSAQQAAAKLSNAANTRLEDARTQKQDYLRAKPTLLEVLFSLGRAQRDWRIQFLAYAASERGAREQARETSRLAECAFTVHRAALTLLDETNQQVSEGLEKLAQIDSELARAREKLGAHFVEPDAAAGDDAQRELSSPWTDRAWNDARAKVFLEALNLHQAFAAANAEIFLGNLLGLADVLSGSVPSSAPHAAVKAAWQTLFAIVPVVSSTFASFDRLFSHLKKEDIGWLLIDEAGQGLPQASVGAIWRSQRAVVVGDPLQLEPILPLPFTSQQALRNRFQVSETWVSGRQSIQRLADRVSPVGTYLPDHEGKPLWVSSPLRVHRRCDYEMFKVANEIAYNGMMVFGTVGRSEISLPGTTWVHVVGRAADGHWIDEEGQVVTSILEDIHDNKDSSSPIYVISPFRDVTNNLRKLLGSRYSKVKVGTIHTVQGKESDVVLLVLGGNPDRPGAKQWASEKPNLLNVAVSRAKRRLYIVGNRDEWKKYEYFQKCAGILAYGHLWTAAVSPTEA